MSLSGAHAKNLLDMLLVAESCLSSGRTVPGMVLLYALIDSMAWVADPKSSNLRARFERWASQWLLPRLPASRPQITATDLYGARCAMLHTGTGVSDLYRSGTARRVLYAWGTADVGLLEYAIAMGTVPDDHVALHCEAFLNSARLAVADFLASAEQDPELARRLIDVANLQYTSIPSKSNSA